MCRECFPWLSPTAISPICSRQLCYIHCSEVLHIKNTVTLKHSCREGRCVQCRSSNPPNSSSWMRSSFWLFYFWGCRGNLFSSLGHLYLKQDGLLYVECLTCLVNFVSQGTLDIMDKQRWDSMVNNTSLGYTIHGGSVPNLLSPPRSEGLGTLKKRLSMDILRGWAPDLGSLSMGLNLNLSPVKWPSLVSVCKWKQTLTGRLKKRQCGTETESQVRKLRSRSTSLCWEVLI